MSELVIRSITKNDVADCLDIYNYEVVNGVATIDLEPRTLTEWKAWFGRIKRWSTAFLWAL